MILATLLLQGLTLPPLIKLLGVDDYDEELEQRGDRGAPARRSRRRWRGSTSWSRRSGCSRTRRARPRRLHLPPAAVHGALAEGEFDGGIDGDGIDYETRSVAYQRLVRELLDAQRATVIELRDRGEINDDVLRRIERELDLEDSRLEI